MDYQNKVWSALNSLIDCDMPADLLPLTITNQAALLAGWDVDGSSGRGWDGC